MYRRAQLLNQEFQLWVVSVVRAHSQAELKQKPQGDNDWMAGPDSQLGGPGGGQSIEEAPFPPQLLPAAGGMRGLWQWLCGFVVAAPRPPPQEVVLVELGTVSAGQLSAADGQEIEWTARYPGETGFGRSASSTRGEELNRMERSLRSGDALDFGRSSSGTAELNFGSMVSGTRGAEGFGRTASGGSTASAFGRTGSGAMRMFTAGLRRLERIGLGMWQVCGTRGGVTTEQWRWA
jgi:hypothetical protein